MEREGKRKGKGIPRRKRMPVHAPVAAVRTRPEPAILTDLDGLDEELADFVGGGLRVTVFTHDHLPQLLLVPPGHIIFPLLLLLPFPFATFPRIRVQVPLLAFSSHIQIVAELALLALLAAALLVELAQHGLGVHAEGHFLHLHRLEQLGGFPLGGFGGGFLALARGLFGFFAFLLGGFGVGGLGLDRLDLFLGGAAFFLGRGERGQYGV